jgi:hypothetical protein
MSIAFPLGHFVTLWFIIWDCQPLTFVLKLVILSCLWFATLLMRITNAKVVYALEHNPKSRVRVTIVQLLIGVSLLLVASLHLAYPEQETFSFAEMSLWGCFIVDALWHLRIWKTTTKRLFRGVKGMREILSRRNSKLKMIEGVKRRQSIVTTAGFLFSEIVACAAMIFINPALDLLLQGKSNECNQRNSVGSHRISAFGFPIFLAVQIAYWVLIYSHVVKKRRTENLRDTKVENRSYVYVSQQAVVLPHDRRPYSGLAKMKTKSLGERARYMQTS